MCYFNVEAMPRSGSCRGAASKTIRLTERQSLSARNAASRVSESYACTAMHSVAFCFCPLPFALCPLPSAFSLLLTAFCFFALMSPNELWHFLPLGYLLTILIETPILIVGLSRRHALKRKVLAGVWLTACTYPIVVLVLPVLFAQQSRTVYLLVAETFAPLAECILFWLAFGSPEEAGKPSMWRDFIAIILANLASFGVGELLNTYGWFGLV